MKIKNRLNWTVVLAVIVSQTVVASEHWEQFHGGYDHAGVWTGNVDTTGIELKWSFNPASQVTNLTNFLWAAQPSVSADGSRIFVYGYGADATETGVIVSLDAHTGEFLWSYNVDMFVGYGSYSSLVYRGGYVYFAGSNGGTGGTSEATVYRINAQDGTTDAASGGWRVTLPDAVEILNASITLADGKLFISSYAGFDPTTAKHYCLNSYDGSIIWSNNDGGQGQGAAGYDSTRGVFYQTVYDASNGHYLRAYDAADGSIVWTAGWSFDTSANEAAFQCGISYLADKIYVYTGDMYTNESWLYIADASNTGALLSGPTTLAASGNSCPTVDPSGNVYLCGNYSGKGDTYALNAAGSLLWTFATAGGSQVSAAWADGYIFIGEQNDFLDSSENNLYILNDSDGSIAKTLAGGGPVAFGERAFYSVGSADGVLYAYSTTSDYATGVVSYSGAGGAAHDDSSTALGRPSVDTGGDGIAAPFGAPRPVVNVYPAWGETQLVTIAPSGSLVLEFDHDVANDPENVFGIDLIVYGNAFQNAQSGSWTYGDPASFICGSGLFTEPATVSVSQDGITWHTFSTPFADDFAPTFGRVYDTVNPHQPDTDWDWNLWWGAPTDGTLPLNPTWTEARYNDKSVAWASQDYGYSAGGTGFDISTLGLEWIRYVKVETGADASEVDAVADARRGSDLIAPGAVTAFSVTSVAQMITLSWTAPTDADCQEFLVLRRIAATVTDTPQMGKGYASGATIDDAVVVYAGEAEGFVDTELAPSTEYHYAVFAADGVLNWSAATTGFDTTQIGYTPVEVITGSGSVGRLPSSVSYFENASVELTATPQTGWEFSHWEGDVTGATPTVTLTVDTTPTYTAVFVALPTYTPVEVITGSGSVGRLPSSVSYFENASVELTATPQTGWEFSHWEGDVTGATPTVTLTVDTTPTYTAVFVALPTYTPVEVITGSGSVGRLPSSVSYFENASVELTATPQTGWEFSHWEGDVTGATPTVTLTVDTTPEYTAVFIEASPDEDIFAGFGCMPGEGNASFMLLIIAAVYLAIKRLVPAPK